MCSTTSPGIGGNHGESLAFRKLSHRRSVMRQPFSLARPCNWSCMLPFVRLPFGGRPHCGELAGFDCWVLCLFNLFINPSRVATENDDSDTRTSVRSTYANPTAMAAPAPANPQIAGLLATANGLGLEFDVAHANNTQATPGGPASAAPLIANSPHNAPPPIPIAGPAGFVPIALLPPCNDRAHHSTTGATPPCLGPNNLRPVIGPGAVLPFPIQQFGPDLRTCAIGGPLHPGGYVVCLHCIRDIRSQAWSQAILVDVSAEPPDLPPPIPRPQPMTPIAAAAHAAAGAPLWTTFMTHLCLSCEREEILLLFQRTLGPAPPARTLPTRRPNRRPWPFTTCTCLEIWHEHVDPAFPGQEVCIRHRYQNACEKHDELLIIRNQNDKWLRETARDRNNPNRIIRLRRNNIGHRNIMNGRANRSSFRACRCGAEPRTGVPQVWMCLGCEGVIHNVPVAAPPPPGGLPPPAAPLPAFVLPPGFPTVRTRRTQRTILTANPFPLRRARN